MLDNYQSLKKISNEITELLQRHEASKQLWKDVFESFSMSSNLPWPYLVFTIAIIIAFLATPSSFGSSHVCALFILFVLLLSMVTSVWNTRKKFNEISSKLQSCIDHLKETYENRSLTDWLNLKEFSQLLEDCDTASIFSSPSHSVSYAYGKRIEGEGITPIPTALLATGDIIALWPGQECPAKLQCAEDDCCVLASDEIFVPTVLESCAIEQHEDSTQSHRFKVLESPIVKEIEKLLSNVGSRNQNAHPTVFERQRTFTMKWILKFLIPLVLVAAYITSVLRYSLLPRPVIPESSSTITTLQGNETINVTLMSSNFHPVWFQYFVETPAVICLPLIPVLLPILLLVLITVGEAKTLAVSQCGRNKLERISTMPTTLTQSSQAFFVKNDNNYRMEWRKLFCKLLWGKDGVSFHRNTGLFLPLGSLTVLCCVDKEGILSWFNPIVEKVFFFKQNPSDGATKTTTEKATKESYDVGMPPVIEESEDIVEADSESINEQNLISDDQKVICETLALSQNAQDPSRVHFDDVMWENHLSSLKPIGLDILLNFCSCSSDSSNFHTDNPRTSFDSEILKCFKQQPEDDYCSSKFLHELCLCTIASSCDCMTPGMSMAKKGLCSLSDVIGFSHDLKSVYQNQQKFTVYRKPVSQSVAKLGTALEQSFTFPIERLGSFTKRNKWKQYLPHLRGVIIKDLLGDCQILVYGSGDLMTECCREIWDGKDIQTMTVQDRRRAVDFYQRSSVAGQCIAFGYIPLTPTKVINDTDVAEDLMLVNLAKADERKRLQDLVQEPDLLNHMIFLGMTTLQHQARFSVCQMVDTLEQACIRFVLFSADNEVRSRVFAEKMGLETGWNCHISLSDSPTDSAFCDGRTSQAHNRSDSSKSRSSSENQKLPQQEDEAEELGSPSSHLLERLSPRTQSESSATDSLFNVSNRAKLPRGINNIVPHIENVDNVPLLVPLFTDSTPETSSEMIKIMQDYGEVVCCIGSSECIRNMSVFHQANVSVAINPVIFPTSDDASPGSSQGSGDSINSLPYTLGQRSYRDTTIDCIALETARKLHYFPCSLLLSGDDGLSIISSMITQARHFLFVLRIFFIFLTKCELTLAMVQLLSHILLLPTLFTPMDVFWLSNIVLPILSLSLLGSQPDSDLMTWANEKTLPQENPVTRNTIRQAMKRYAVKFLPSALALVTCYTLMLRSVCLDVRGLMIPMVSNTSDAASFSVNTTIDVQCFPNFLITISSSVPDINSDTYRVPLWEATEHLREKYRMMQLLIMSFFVLYLCIISIGYVHRWKRLTRFPPYLNKFWSITVPVLLMFQVVGAIISFYLMRFAPGSNDLIIHPALKSFSNSSILDLGDSQTLIFLILAIWPLPCIVFNELWKWREIKLWNRWQKRARLNFGTKLGMNSPF